ncbi:MAG: alpha/beta hydrolase [Planctomycetota bacterium]|jgi:esterase/lipase superfamily enzyme
MEAETKTVNVYYATDRAPETSDDSGVKYGWERAYLERDEPYAVGVCQVEITRQRSHDQTPPLPRSRDALVALVSTSPLERSQFYDQIREDMWYAAADGLFVFVHGYNNSFEQAAKRSAEIWYDVGFDGPPIMFSWPSRGGSFWRGIFSYFADAETIEWSSVHLKAFLEELVAETTPEKLFADEPARIHLIAHSMGCRALTRALVLIADDLKANDPPIFCDVILAAPDIDRDVFSDVILPDLLASGVAEHYTLYASSSDAVIRTSGGLSEGGQRRGRHRGRRCGQLRHHRCIIHPERVARPSARLLHQRAAGDPRPDRDPGEGQPRSERLRPCHAAPRRRAGPTVDPRRRGRVAGLSGAVASNPRHRCVRRFWGYCGRRFYAVPRWSERIARYPRSRFRRGETA